MPILCREWQVLIRNQGTLRGFTAYLRVLSRNREDSAMKISRKLKTSIHQVIHQMVFEHTKIIDTEDRTLRIPHESWRAIHKSACAVMAYLPAKVIEEIERYTTR